MGQKNSIFKVGIFYLIGTVFYRGIAFLMIPIFTRLMDKSEYGILNTYSSWVSVLTIVFSLALYMGLRASFIDYENDAHRVLTTVVVFTVIYCAVVIAAAVLIINVFDIRDKTMILCCMGQSMYAALLDDYLMYLMMTKAYKLRIALMIVPEVIVNAVSVVFIFNLSEKRYLGKIVPSTVLYLMMITIIVVVSLRKEKNCFSEDYLRYCLRISLPLVFHGLASYVLNQSDRVMITYIRNSAENGIYSLVYNIGMLSTAVSYSLEGVWVPWFTERMKEDKIGDINARAKDYTNLMAFVMCGLVLLAPELMKIFAPPEYEEGYIIIPAIVFANFIVFLYTLYVNIEHYYKKVSSIAVNTLIAAVSNITLNLIFIPMYGYAAAAYTTLASFLLSLLMHAHTSKKLKRELYPISHFGFAFIEIVGVSVIYYLTHDLIALRFPALALIIVLNVYLNREMLKKILKKFRKSSDEQHG